MWKPLNTRRTQGKQYAQTFILDRPVLVKSIDLAMHKFGDDGQLWIELFADDNGRPGEHHSSDMVLLKGMPFSATTGVGVRFRRFRNQTSAGSRHLAALGFTGSPIVNWSSPMQARGALQTGPGTS
ncbi:MAG: hypothetical protein U5J82_06555 [Desulfobacterales bacterium]|nr:hypothetical protein [Desulfobacterales bacterium]